MEMRQDAPETPSYPPFDNEYFEWVDVLEAILPSMTGFRRGSIHFWHRQHRLFRNSPTTVNWARC